MNQRIEYIDFARGYAIFTIVCYHALQQVALTPLLQRAIIFGGTGVHLFFLLSGFGLLWSAAPDNALAFYRRRFTKVWLPYLLALTLSFLATFFVPIFTDGWDAWLAGVALYQMFSASYIVSFGGHFWFISAILQFYLVFPLLLRLHKRLGAAPFLGLAFLLSLAWWALVYFLGKGEWRNWNSFFLQFLWEFALGMYLAERMQRDPTVNTLIRNILNGENRGWWLSLPLGLLFSGLMVALVAVLGEVGRIFNDLPALLGYTALSIFLYQCSVKALPFLKRFFIWINGFSYALYLTHVLVLHLFLHGFGIVQASIPILFLYLLLALAAARLFEPLSQAWTRLWAGGNKKASKTLYPPIK